MSLREIIWLGRMELTGCDLRGPTPPAILGDNVTAAAQQPHGCSVSALATTLWLQCTSSSSSVALVYQLSYPARNQASTQKVGELRFIMPAGSEEITLWSLSPKEGFHKAFMGQFFWVHAWRTGVRSGKAVDAEASLQKQMCGEGVVGAVGWTLLSHHGWGLSFLPFYQDIFSYNGLIKKRCRSSCCGSAVESDQCSWGCGLDPWPPSVG